MKRVYVGNLSFRAAEADLEAAFAAFGQVRSVSIIRDRDTGQSRGFAFVEMENDDEAAAAISGLNGTQLAGRTITVNEARPQERREGGRGGPRGGGPGRPRSGGSEYGSRGPR